MAPSYDPTLRSRIPGSNQSEGFVLNSNFQEWENFITKIHEIDIIPDKTTESEDYSLDKTLLRLCQEHELKHRTPTTHENTLMLVHPFYLHLYHMSSISYHPDKLNEADNYLTTLLGLLEQNKREKRVNVVVLEMANAYAALTSLLTEQGIVDRVLFTLPDNGLLFHPDEFNDFQDSNIFFGGGYNGACLSTSIREIKNILMLKHIKAIQDLVINPPTTKKLNSGRIYEVRRSDVITLEEASQLFGLEVDNLLN
nr:hypothetical protein [Nanoarchaeum sp.]